MSTEETTVYRTNREPMGDIRMVDGYPTEHRWRTDRVVRETWRKETPEPKTSGVPHASSALNPVRGIEVADDAEPEDTGRRKRRNFDGNVAALPQRRGMLKNDGVITCPKGGGFQVRAVCMCGLCGDSVRTVHVGTWIKPHAAGAFGCRKYLASVTKGMPKSQRAKLYAEAARRAA